MTDALTLAPDQPARDKALDTNSSCIVQAPAGSGKTTLLATRYLALLAKVSRPEEILAITFTKKAAAEMRHKVLSLLDEENPLTQLVWERNAQHGWLIEENPGVLKIQTIDSFAMELSSQTPDTKGVQGLGIVENAEQYYAKAATALLRSIFNNQQLAPLIADFLALVDNDAESTQSLVSHMLAHRDQWQDVALAAAQDGQQNVQVLKNMLKNTVQHLHNTMAESLFTQLTQEDLATLHQVGEHYAQAGPWYAVLPYLLREDGQLRKRLTSKQGFSAAEPRRTLNLWLSELHERGLAPSLQALARAPTAENVDDQTIAAVQLCCVNLSLAVLELEQLFDSHRVTDFTGLLVSARRALRDADGNPTDLALYLDYRIHHVLVDEFQDTSRSQFEFFKLLLDAWDHSGSNTFFAVGDPMQSIYRFRDADVNIFAECRDDGIAQRHLKTCQLTANFRSSTHLVDWCNALFHKLFGGVVTNSLGHVQFNTSQAMKPQSDAQNAVSCLTFDDINHETIAATQQIQTLLEASSDSRIAILCRSRTHLSPLLKQMKQLGIAWQANDMDLLKNRPAVADLLAMHSMLTRPDELLAWFVLLRSPLFGLELTTLTQLSEQGELLHNLRSYAPDNARITRLLKGYDWAISTFLECPLRESLEGFWIRCGGADAYTLAEQEDVQSALDLIEAQNQRDLSPNELSALVEKLFAAAEADARVEVMTIHKSKGLEYDHVFVPYLHKSTQPDDARLFTFRPTAAGTLLGVRGDAVHQWLQFEERERARNEEKRLLYVACTRARASLWLSYTSEQERKPSGLAGWLWDLDGIPITQASALSETMTAHTDQETNKLQNANEVQLQNDLFSSQFNLRLPSDYQWQPAPYDAITTSASESVTVDTIADRYEVVLGNLVHQCLAWIAMQQNTTFRPPDPQLMHHMLAQWVSQSSDDAGREKLIEDSERQCMKVLQSEIGRWVLFPHRDHAAELPISGVYADTVRNIILDRTFEDEDGQRWVIDYKTTLFDKSTRKEQLTAQTKQRYAPQLRMYAEIAANLYQQKIRAGLFLTDLAEFVPFDESELKK